MSFETPDGGIDPRARGRVDGADRHLEAMEEGAARARYAREAEREMGGGPLRRALARIWPSLRPAPAQDGDRLRAAGEEAGPGH